MYEMRIIEYVLVVLLKMIIFFISVFNKLETILYLLKKTLRYVKNGTRNLN